MIIRTILFSARQLVSFWLKNAFLFQSIEINNNKHVYRQSQARKETGSGVEWAECSLITGMGYWIQAFSLILYSSVGSSAGIQSAGDLVPETLFVRLYSTGEDNWSFFNSTIPCLCQSIKVNNKHACCQRQVRRPTSTGVEWVECSRIMGTGYWALVLTLILDSSVGSSAGIQSHGDLDPETLVRILHSAVEDNLSPFDLEIACLSQSIELTATYMYIARARGEQ